MIRDVTIGEVGVAFSTSDRRSLDNLARQAMRLTALQRPRERLVTVREEEWRLLRRDLHDGLNSWNPEPGENCRDPESSNTT